MILASTKPEVHNVSQRRRRKTRVTHNNLVKIAGVVPEISSRTDRHTDTHTHTHTDVLITKLPCPLSTVHTSNNVEATGNIVEAMFDFVEATFDFVATNGNNVERVS